MKRVVWGILMACLLVGLSSCARAPLKPVHSSEAIYSKVPVPGLRQDFFHIVAPGETLWRIGKMYDVPMKNIVSANNLESEALEKGQRLLVPQAAPIAPVISLYPSRKWKYIIIHHSATDEGNSLYFDRYHQKKGWEGIGYHFVIGNGTKEKQDGQIEVSPRWLKQHNGSHCRANNMNQKAIGICLVGNFSKDDVSSKQLDALVYLVQKLQRYYKIPLKNIMGHGQVVGAKTDCPGKSFPWVRFKERL